jgi:uncharacterized protein (DUF2147 family)
MKLSIRPQRFWIFTLAVIVSATLITIARTSIADELSPVGVWATDGNDSHVKIEKCGTTLCGTIVWLKDPYGPDGQDAVDDKNPDPALRSKKLVGMMLLTGFEQDSDNPNVWLHGKIYDPDDGKTYSCKLTVQDAKTLLVRGYIGFSLLGKTQTWNRSE